MISLHSTLSSVPNTDYFQDVHRKDITRSPKGSLTSTAYFTPPQTPNASSPSKNETRSLPYPSTLLRGKLGPCLHSTVSSSGFLSRKYFTPHSTTNKSSLSVLHPSLLRRLPPQCSFALPQANSGSWSRSTTSSDFLWWSSRPPPKSSAVDATPIPLMLTAEIVAIADNALLKYEDICLQHPSMV